MGLIRCDHSAEYHCRHILRSTLCTVFANTVSLEPKDPSKVPIINSAYWILILGWR